MNNYLIEVTDDEFVRIAALIKAQCGISLKDEKKSLVNSRLQKLLLDKAFSSFSEYYQFLLVDRTGAAMNELVNSITTNHTFFMRESAHFDYFKKTVLPYLKKTITDRDMRIWCAASSTGEEAYTLAMVIDEYLMSEKLWWDTKVLATDISTEVLDTAKAGIYKKANLATMPKQWILNYFLPCDDENLKISEKIKNEVIFRRFNLIQDVFPFKRKFHTIFCRNVMIYFDGDTQRQLIEKFYDSLEYGGYIFIGHTEAIRYEQSKFKYMGPSVYRKI
jgi:chemotaxis protein methyltransferase CheR